MFNIKNQKAGRSILNIGSNVRIEGQIVEKDDDEKIYTLIIIDVSDNQIDEIKKRLDDMNLTIETE